MLILCTLFTIETLFWELVHSKIGECSTIVEFSTHLSVLSVSESVAPYSASWCYIYLILLYFVHTRYKVQVLLLLRYGKVNGSGNDHHWKDCYSHMLYRKGACHAVGSRHTARHGNQEAERRRQKCGPDPLRAFYGKSEFRQRLGLVKLNNFSRLWGTRVVPVVWYLALWWSGQGTSGWECKGLRKAVVGGLFDLPMKDALTGEEGQCLVWVHSFAMSRN